MTTFVKRVITGLLFGLAFWSVFLYLPPYAFSILLFLIATLIVVFEWKNLFRPYSFAFWLILPFYPLLPICLLMLLNHNPVYRPLLFGLFVIAFSHDTGSYIIGKLAGRHRIWPSISPNKTWEGFWGGYLFAIAGLELVLWEQKIYKSVEFVLVLALVTCALSFLGDIFESYFKRRAQVKDSGNLLPGHGGFLDRFDGILFTTYFLYFFKDVLVTLIFGS